ncbi:hypothetical protein M0805_008893 [Coniferiporia weirii]|nr:hypothetical protein M0805_008893 [Coniferiporia weirii]
MSRPNPLKNVYSAYRSTLDQQLLTPRTPHSRAGRAEEARHGLDNNLSETDSDLDIVHGDSPYTTVSQQQHEPLLASSASASFPHRRARPYDTNDERVQEKGKKAELNWGLILSRIPLLAGLTTALFLLFLVVMSVEKPETLRSYLYDSAPESIGGGQTVDNAQVTTVASTENQAPTKTAMTLSYASYTSFPLKPTQYSEECAGFLSSMKGPMGTYWYIPPGGPMDVVHPDEETTGDSKICKSSITYMLDGYVGLAADLALMAQAAGLAREQNRTFFVNDQYWNRGKWSDHFQDVRVLQPGPEPGCLPPPAEELVACPRTARHWVVGSRTAVFHFGHGFADEFENPYARELRRLKQIFTRAARSLTHTIRPNAQNAALIQTARREAAAAGPYVALHARRGDRKAEAWGFHGGYVPLADFVAAAHGTTERLELASPSSVYIASDDPAARAELAELLTNGDGETRVFALDRSAHAELRALASEAPYVQRSFAALGDEERVQATRGALVDFALVSGMWAWGVDGEEGPEAVVCTIGSNFCKLAAVGFGWERAFGFDEGDPDTTLMRMDDERKRWVEIDNAGNIVPVWRAFEMF